jgi:DNA-binding NarL/FixJ family response regulator
VSEVSVPSARAGACRVLIAEDDARVRESLHNLLDGDGFTVVGAAADGNEAVTMAEALRPHVILMDYRMPGLNGIEAAREVKRRLPHAEVVVLSAYDDQLLRQLAEAEGVYRFLVKGCAPTLIAQTVCEAFARSEVFAPRQAPDPLHRGE